MTAETPEKAASSSGSALSVATGCDDAGCGIVAVGAADICASFAIGFGGDAAGVDDDHVGFGCMAFGGSGVAKKSGYRFSVGTGGAATEVFDVEGGRHRVSLTEQRG